MKLSKLDRAERGFIATWQDGSENEYPFIWLRDNDQLELHPQTHERIFDLCSVELDIKPDSYELVTSDNQDCPKQLEVRWPGKIDPSIYELSWLYNHRPGRRRYDPAKVKRNSWRAGQMQSIPNFDASLCKSHAEALKEALLCLKTTGIIIIINLEDTADAGQKFGDLIGFKRESNYGVMFEVRSKKQPNNLAYTALELPLHTDLANQEFIPGNQFLHCYRNNAKGGGSRFADAMAIVEDFKLDHPDYYQLLTELEVPWQFVDDQTDLRQHRPVIGLNTDGSFRGLTFNAHLAGIPDFETQELYAFYAAFRELMCYVRKPEYRIEHVLNNGEMVIFDNQRVLHGRASFDPSSGDRHLRGYYIEHNEIENRIRMLSKSGLFSDPM